MHSNSKRFRSLLLVTCTLALAPGTVATRDATDLTALIQDLKNDTRGPYQRIAWFCPDGTIRGANEPCPEGGIQHALRKDVVVEIEREFGVYLGQILAGTPYDAFLDEANGFSRLKQFQLERFLRAADDGWIMRRAQHYRGAVQAEDESAWGAGFLPWLLSRDGFLTSHFYLGREAVRDVPHHESEGKGPRIRALSKRIADTYPPFMDIRVKIHGRPGRSDVRRVRAFLERHGPRVSPDVREQLEALARDLETVYRSATVEGLRRYLGRIPPAGGVAAALRTLIDTDAAGWPGRVALEPDTVRVPAGALVDSTGARAAADTVIVVGRFATVNPVAAKCRALAGLLWSIREDAVSTRAGDTRLALMDLSLDIETILFRAIGEWRPQTTGELVTLNSVLAEAGAGCGFLEMWEWRELQPRLEVPDSTEALAEFSKRVAASRRAVEWGAATVRSTYESVVALYSDFEPMAGAFVDDRIRGSILLALGDAASRLSRAGARLTGVANTVFDLGEKAQARGLNPGFTAGELEVVEGRAGGVKFSPEKIYVLRRPPEDLEPVAGIVSVSGGNAVSHVQLLARNLGIPNAAVTQKTFELLRAYSGERVFFAVSPRGRVLMKPAARMTPDEKALVEHRRLGGHRIQVPTDKIDLALAHALPLDSLRASDSGRVCGPKAANLGQLKLLFPDRVAPGLVIPFGVFRRHMDRPMPGSGGSYWEFLEETFRRARAHRDSVASEAAVETYVLSRLSLLRDAIRRMPVLPADREDLGRVFTEVFGVSPGRVPVFIRSDTNMEDLADFTGAGLNLTEANVVSEDDILKAVRNVWASPFTERSYRWRQRYLANPENVYPSVLILRSIDVDKSGVMITAGLETAGEGDITIAFNRGAGGAVAGQAAEMFLLAEDGRDVLLSPARAARYTRLPATGGTREEHASFESPIVTSRERDALRELAAEVEQQLSGVRGAGGSYDIELGFSGGTVWLFQVRPLVENEGARASEYLRGMDPVLPAGAGVSPDQKLPAAKG
ncbi:MAG: PEP/pyruvate-binding domain-containing protein [Candidatus Krumholzibacteriia bacterium]